MFSEFAAALLGAVASSFSISAASETVPAPEFPQLFRLGEAQLGRAPHQIAFPANGRALVAVAGSDQVVELLRAMRPDGTPDSTLGAPRIQARWTLEDSPLGVAETPAGLLATRFRSGGVWRLEDTAQSIWTQLIDTGAGASLLIQPPPLEFGMRFHPSKTGSLSAAPVAVVSEQTDRFFLIDGETGELLSEHPTGRRPFPPALTSDCRLAFVPNYDDGTVTVLDLWNERVVATTEVGAQPSGAVVLPGDRWAAVCVRGANRVALINTASFEVDHTWGVGESPFSIVVDPKERYAFVNNTGSSDVSVFALRGRGPRSWSQTVEDEAQPFAGVSKGRIPTGAIPICMAVSPDSEELWVACEGSHTLEAFGLSWDAVDVTNGLEDLASQGAEVSEGEGENSLRVPGGGWSFQPYPKTQVAVMGMIHSSHLESELWGLFEVEEVMRRFAPDAVLTEIPPNRWEAVKAQVIAGEEVSEPRTKVFAEYRNSLLHLAHELDIEVVPTAGWTTEMNDLRRTRMGNFQSDESRATEREEYAQAQADAVLGWQSDPTEGEDGDDPFVIHCARYDARTKVELGVYDQFLNDQIGPGGWANINKAHMDWVHRAIDERPGSRLLVTFGAGHKYWFLESLRERIARRGDVELVDLRPFLGKNVFGDFGSEGNETMPSDDREQLLKLQLARIEREVLELHQFFEDWFCGRLENTDAVYSRFENAMGPGFEITGPDGHQFSREPLLTGIRTLYGRDATKPLRPDGTADLRIWVENVQITPVPAEGESGSTLFDVRYEEWQETDGEKRGRQSVGQLQRSDANPSTGFVWLRLREEWL